jgi:hypothetical protein
MLVEAFVANAAVPAGEGEFAAGLVHCCLRPLSLLPSSDVAPVAPPSFRASGSADAEILLGQGMVPDLCLSLSGGAEAEALHAIDDVCMRSKTLDAEKE